MIVRKLGNFEEIAGAIKLVQVLEKKKYNL